VKVGDLRHCSLLKMLGCFARCARKNPESIRERCKTKCTLTQLEPRNPASDHPRKWSGVGYDVRSEKGVLAFGVSVPLFREAHSARGLVAVEEGLSIHNEA